MADCSCGLEVDPDCPTHGYDALVGTPEEPT